MTTLPCNHTSVGILVLRDQRLLLINRARVPYGWAPPAGHIDPGETPVRAATSELFEETGLAPTFMHLVLTKQYPNHCRRADGDRHNWSVFYAECPPGPTVRSLTETRDLTWAAQSELQALVELSNRHCRSHSNALAWRSNPGLEPVWAAILNDIKLTWRTS